MRRKISRIKAMMYLYQYDLLKGVDSFEHLDELLEECDEANYDEKLYDTLISDVILNLPKIDRIIALSLSNYSLDRLSYVDRALIRIGTYEMLFTDTPKSVIINEIIEISKDYSEIEGFSSSKFNNSLLDNIRKRIENKA